MVLASFLSRSDPIPAASVRIGGRLTGKHVLVPILGANESRVADQVRVAMTLVRSTDGEVRLVDPMDVDNTRKLETSAPRSEVTEAADWAVSQRTEARKKRPGGVFSGRRVERRVIEYVDTHDIDTLVIPGELGRGPLGRRRHDRLATRAPCDVVSINGARDFSTLASLLLPIANGPHSGLATDVATRIAEESSAEIDVLHVISPDADEETRRAAQDRIDTAIERTGLPASTNPWLLESDHPEQTIIDQSSYYGLTVIGAPSSSRLHRFFHGSTSQSIREQAESVVIAARTPLNGA